MDTLGIELNSLSIVFYVGRFPSHVHTRSLAEQQRRPLSALPRDHTRQIRRINTMWDRKHTYRVTVLPISSRIDVRFIRYTRIS
jgi:hypothetical protein